MSQSLQDSSTAQVIGLAGVLQAVYLVDQLARTGSCPPESFNPSINSLFQFDADSSADVYGGVHGVNLGLRVLQDILGGASNSDYRMVIRYALGVLYLQRKLATRPELLQIIRNRLEHAALKADHFTEDPREVCASIAAIYQDTLSTFKYRIQIGGSMQQLQNPAIANQIRALLLASVRAAVLWRQSGGKRWHLFLSRHRLLKTTRALMVV